MFSPIKLATKIFFHEKHRTIPRCASRSHLSGFCNVKPFLHQQHGTYPCHLPHHVSGLLSLRKHALLFYYFTQLHLRGKIHVSVKFFQQILHHFIISLPRLAHHNHTSRLIVLRQQRTPIICQAFMNTLFWRNVIAEYKATFVMSYHMIRERLWNFYFSHPKCFVPSWECEC